MRKCHASANFAPCIVHATLVRNLLCSATPHEIFSFLFFDVNSFLILVISQSQALLFKDYKRGVNHLLKIYLYFFTLSEIFLLGRNTEFSLLFFLLFYFSFSWKPNNF